MKRPFQITIFALGVIAVAVSLPAQIVWNFGTGGANLNPSSNPLSDLAVSSFSGANASFVNNVTSASTTYSGASGEFNVGLTAPVGALNTSASAYFQFTLTPDSGYQVNVTNISFGSRSTPTGPTSLSIRSSLDSYSTSLASDSSLTAGVWSRKTPALTSISSTGALTIRLYGFGGTGSPSGANWRIDDFTVNATVSAIPEPATYAAIFGGLALLGVMLQRRRKQKQNVTA